MLVGWTFARVICSALARGERARERGGAARRDLLVDEKWDV